MRNPRRERDSRRCIEPGARHVTARLGAFALAAASLIGLAGVESMALAKAPRADEPVKVAQGDADGGLRAGDRVRFEVVGEIDPLELRLPLDGRVTLAGVGTVSCIGKTTRTLTTEIEALLAEAFVGSPSVAVNVVEFAPRRVYVLQGVRAPGAYEIPVGETLRLTQVLSLAGGLASDARRGDVRILRERADGGRPSVIRFDLSEITVAEKVENDIRIRAGDTIVIADPATPDAWIYIGGAVRKPGRYPLLRGDRLTALRAVVAAGGFAPEADPGSVRLLRTGGEGSETRRLDLRAAVSKDPGQDVELAAGDVLVVPGGVF